MESIIGRKTKPAYILKKVPRSTATESINTSPTATLSQTHYYEYQGSRNERRRKKWVSLS